MNSPLFLGIDTSAYTTSVALVDEAGTLVADERRVLQVPRGSRGLRQSEAVFQHVRHLPELFEVLPAGWGDRVQAVAASGSPRPVPESYMPVFLVGHGAARQVAAARGVPLLTISHQENHAWAGFWSAGRDVPQRFLLLHASGGTTEVLRGRRGQPGRIALDIVGATQDLAAGQMVDRVGVALGLPFPAGPHLEQLAQQAEPGTFRLPVSVQRDTVSFSGPTTAALRAVEQGTNAAAVALAVLECVAATLIGLVERAAEREEAGPEGSVPVLLAVGGVMANGLIRARLEEACRRRGIECVFAAPRWSVDNAVGAAVAASVFASRHRGTFQQGAASGG